MDPAISRQLVDKMYEKRKAAALDLEKQIRECHQQGDHRRITQIIDQLVEMFSNPSNALHVKNGGLIGLAGTAIALGVDVAPYMEKFIEPLLVCFADTENRIRYFSAECLYNIAKVSKGEILVYFNPIFDALSKLAADSELSVKNGAELLDRLLKDIVAESASVYVPQYAETVKKARLHADQVEGQGILVPHPEEVDNPTGDGIPPRKAFSLAHFIPLLSDRIYVVSPFTRSFLASWITVLDSVPELELISYLPEFLDGLLKYLSDPTEDVRVATENLLADFLREVREVAIVQKKAEEKAKLQRDIELYEQNRRPEGTDGLPDITMAHPERAAFIAEDDGIVSTYDTESIVKEEGASEVDYRDTGAWSPGLGVKVDHAAIVESLIQQLDNQHDEIQQSTALVWLAEFLGFAQDVMVPFTPRLITAILPNLAHHVPMIQSAALRTNKLLYEVIQNLPAPVSPSLQQFTDRASIASSRIGQPANSPPPTVSPGPSRQSTASRESGTSYNTREPTVVDTLPEVNSSPASDRTAYPSRHRTSTTPLPSEASSSVTASASASDVDGLPQSQTSRSHSPTLVPNTSAIQPTPQPPPQELDPFDYKETVDKLTFQFLSEHEDTRVAALKWLIMLHQKAPKKILAMDDGTFPALLKTLSDSSEDVRNLPSPVEMKALTQFGSSEEGYFKAFMVNLLDIFSTDRRLLETRGSLIIRQLCLNLNTERIYRTLAEILEREEDLEFASVMVQKLNIILITSPELAEFRRRLKSLETRAPGQQDGQALFSTLYRSWCHNAVAVFALCLLAQAYEHASNLLSIFADLEVTVQLLVQVDKLVQLIESPVFTYIRLQLLEPEKYPYLFKCLYGLLMILPQSTAFVSLRNRLNAVNSAGFLHIAPRSTAAPFTARSKVGRGEEIKWQELLTHFRSVQIKHEKARRTALGMDGSSSGFSSGEIPLNGTTPVNTALTTRPATRRRVTGEIVPPPPPAYASRGTGALSPLNPKARGGAAAGLLGFAQRDPPRPRSPTAPVQGNVKAKRTTSLAPGKM